MHIPKLSSIIPKIHASKNGSRHFTSLSSGRLGTRRVTKNPVTRVGFTPRRQLFTSPLDIVAASWIVVGTKVTDEGFRGNDKILLILGLITTLFGIEFSDRSKKNYEEKFLSGQNCTLCQKDQLYVTPGGVFVDRRKTEKPCDKA